MGKLSFLGKQWAIIKLERHQRLALSGEARMQVRACKGRGKSTRDALLYCAPVVHMHMQCAIRLRVFFIFVMNLACRGCVDRAISLGT